MYYQDVSYPTTPRTFMGMLVLGSKIPQKMPYTGGANITLGGAPETVVHVAPKTLIRSWVILKDV